MLAGLRRAIARGEMGRAQAGMKYEKRTPATTRDQAISAGGGHGYRTEEVAVENNASSSPLTCESRAGDMTERVNLKAIAYGQCCGRDSIRSHLRMDRMSNLTRGFEARH